MSDLLGLVHLPERGVAPEALHEAVAQLAASLPGTAPLAAAPDVEGIARAALAAFGRVRAGYDPSAQALEAALRALVADAMSLPPAATIVFTGSGSESLLLALAAARARRGAGAIVASQTVHPATLRAAGLLGMDMRRVPERPACGADLESLSRAMGEGAAAVVASAPAWSDGRLDPVSEIANLAASRGADGVVDACIGGLLYPFTDDGPMLVGPGVSAVAVDLHKSGYAPHNLSVVCFLDPAGAAATAFESDDWDGFLYRSAGVAGDRPLGPLTAAWVTMLGLGRVGYRARAQRLDERRARLAEAAQAAGLSLARAPATVAVCLAPGGEGLEQLGRRLAAAGVPHIVCPRPGFIRLRVEPLSDDAAFTGFVQRLGELGA